MTIRIPALKVRQWLPTWDQVEWDAARLRGEPPHSFLVLSMKARDLKQLSAIYRRQSDSGIRRADDLGIQRRHDKKRSEKIREFVQYGYPYCDLTEFQKASGDHESLRKPGWLPTGIVINILGKNDERLGQRVAEDDLVRIESKSGTDQFASLVFPENFNSSDWQPMQAAPIEVVDGQHRLWAFEEEDFAPDFEMPVIAFCGLDISWQAYLFWSINISPVKINASLAFDMYPLLRAEDWLDKMEGHRVYREARAQELVESIWVHPKSPWRNRIDMLAEPNNPYVRQSAWIKSLISAFIKPLDMHTKRGGLFGSIRNQKHEVLPWTRMQQAAFLIFFGSALLAAMRRSNSPWIDALRRTTTQDLVEPDREPGMFNKQSLLNTDQGIRALWLVLNDICAARVIEWGFFDWRPSDEVGSYSDAALSQELEEIGKLSLAGKLEVIAESLSSFDWRTSSADGLTEDERLRRKVFRGSGGYVELKKLVLDHVFRTASDADVASAAKSAIS
ncbi:MAG TPA: DGQHR domain-containing protein [Gallionella sp.]|nr:DGQHR domain-containing protein [Gallionella sp.]